MSNLIPILPEAFPYKLSRKRGPHNWDTITPEDFALTWDFELENHNELWIFTPVSEAALQWCYCKLAPDCPRWGARGFIIEKRFLAQIVAGARDDNLMTPDDYEQAMEEASQIAHQGEGL